MSPETRDFLTQVRKAESPTRGDESRVLATIEATLAGPPTGGASGGAPATKSIGSAAGAGLKVVATLLGVSVGAALVAAAVSSGTAERPVASQPKRASAPNVPLGSSAPLTASTAPGSSASVASPAAAPPNGPHLSRRTTPSAAPASSVSLREELALLGDVQAALERGDGAEALRRLDGRATSDRQFVAERRAARIAALCLLGRVAEAQQLGALFFRENAQSVQRTAVERSCAATKTDPER